MKAKRVGPSRWLYVIPGVIFLIATIGAPVGLVLSFSHQLADGEQFLAPGQHTITVAEPRKYIIWHNAETFYKGMQYSSPHSLPEGTRIEVIQEHTDTEIATKSTMGGTETSENMYRYSICSFEAPEAGDYTITVKDLPDSRVIMVRESLGRSFVTLFLVILFICFAGWILLPIFILVVEVKRYRNRRSEANEAPQEPSGAASLATPEAPEG